MSVKFVPHVKAIIIFAPDIFYYFILVFYTPFNWFDFEAQLKGV